ncbi:MULTISPECIES: hypothetical protein [unclassified Methanosarcina]|uniref:hypothetical protein n=1 Tax=unclassified Methanosarcina TaxID=2644672 RepID=UPI00064E7400|nr:MULTISPECIES: hypothetical protein [unclassified Methanosarcina]
MKTGNLPEEENSGIKIYRIIELYSTLILLQVTTEHHRIYRIWFTGLPIHSGMVEPQLRKD